MPLTISWIEGWYTTVISDHEVKDEVLKRYPEAVITPIGVQSLVWANQKDRDLDKEKRRYIASII